jgi:hypothetical protein
MESEKKPNQPEEQEAVYTTIVGGRPPGSGTRVGAIPRGVEVLLKKASVDPEFRKLLLEQRGDAARAIDLELTEAEREMLAHIPAEQLEQIITNTKVKPRHRAIFLGTAGVLMLAAVIGLVPYSLVRCTTLGISPDEIRRVRVASQDAEDTDDPNASDQNLALEQVLKALEDQRHRDPRLLTLGIRPDEVDGNTAVPNPNALKVMLGIRPDVPEGAIEVIRGRERHVEEVEPQDEP